MTSPAVFGADADAADVEDVIALDADEEEENMAPAAIEDTVFGNVGSTQAGVRFKTERASFSSGIGLKKRIARDSNGGEKRQRPVGVDAVG